MRVLLVYSNQARDLLPAPPIGLSYVAGATRRAGHDVRAFAPEVVGFSVRNIDNVVSQRPVWHLGELARMLVVVRRESRAPIVLGGPAVSILGAAALTRLDADFAVVGEGEETSRDCWPPSGARRARRGPALLALPADSPARPAGAGAPPEVSVDDCAMNGIIETSRRPCRGPRAPCGRVCRA